MNIDYLRTFLTLAENGSFSETAKEHIVVQSTVSSRIQELEKELGQSLFIRNYNSRLLSGQARGTRRGARRAGAAAAAQRHSELSRTR